LKTPPKPEKRIVKVSILQLFSEYPPRNRGELKNL